MESRKDDHLLVFNEEKHSYSLDGAHVPGVTTFLKGGYPTSSMLTNWMCGQSAEYVWDRFTIRNDFEALDKKEIIKEAKVAYKIKSEEAAGIGTTVHDYAYMIESGKPDDAALILAKAKMSPHWEQINNGITKFQEWHGQNQGQTVLLEAIIASVAYKFGGKFDHLSLRGGKLVLSDYKTSNGIYVDYLIQLAAYAVAIEEWLDKWLAQYGLPLKVGGLEILRFGKEDGDYQTLMVDNEIEIRQLKEQAIRCRQTYGFARQWESDKRFKYNGATGNSKIKEPGLKRVSRRQSVQDTTGKVGEVTE